MQFIHLYFSINLKKPKAESLFHYYLQIQSPVPTDSNQQLHTLTNPWLTHSSTNTFNNLFIAVVPDSHIASSSCILKPLEDINSHLIYTNLNKITYSDAEKSLLFVQPPPSNSPMQGQGASITHRKCHLLTLFLLHRVIWLCVHRPAELSCCIKRLFKVRIFPHIWSFMCSLGLWASPWHKQV